MKKLFACILVICLALPLLAGCNGGTEVVTALPSWMNGKDALRLMLANERLDVNSLKSSESIFATGAEVLNNLAEMTVESLSQYEYAAGPSVDLIADRTVTETDGSVIEIDGQIYKYKSFAEYSNSYDYFLNLTRGISTTAERGAELIDNVKKYVRAVDVWVAESNQKFYLHVEENSETLYSYYADTQIAQYEICRRTKGADGLDIYEVYISNDIGETLMTYIPGKKCEYSHRSRETDFDHNFLAENTKGYWEVVDVGSASTHYNVSCMVIKDDICYDAFYTPTHIQDEFGRGDALIEGYINTLKVISSDRKTDIMRILPYLQEMAVTVNLQAFSGYSHAEFPASSIESYEVGTGQRAHVPTVLGDLVLNNGTRLVEGMTLLDGKVKIGGTRVHHQNKEEGLSGYAPELEITILPHAGESWQDVFREFLLETGLSCTRNMDTVEAGIAQALGELASFTKYHKWNDSPIESNDTIAKGFENLDARFKAYSAMYDAIKNAEVIEYSRRDAIELRIPFAPITAMSAASVAADGLYVTVNELSLTVEDTALFVEGEPYAVHFAMIGVGENDQGLVHIAYENAREFVYNGEQTFTVSASAEFDIPFLSAGEYALVAYVSTADGIRTSAYRAVAVDQAIGDVWDQDGISGKTYRTDAGELHAIFAGHSTVRIPLAQELFASYATLLSALKEAAYRYGYVEEGASLEIQGEQGDWIAVTDSEAPLAYGIYRLPYAIRNGRDVREGYVTAQYLTPGGQ